MQSRFIFDTIAAMLPKVIFFMGLPGSGKGTQAEIVVDRYGFFHFDTGKELERKLHDPAEQHDPFIQRERENFDTGKLNTPEWVREVVKEKIREYAGQGKELVFSGSPRTRAEAEALFPVFGEIFGKENLVVFLLEVKEETSLFRNSNRRVCEKCRIPVVWNSTTEKWFFCPRCGGALVRRTLDNPEVIKKRFQEFHERTEPAITYLEEQGAVIVRVPGEDLPEVVAERVRIHLEGV
ncbi:MAG: hypothetical protein A3I44_02540 [Candidatus Sungbacteria bacterium RIFCSPLOWO2_02_FULL_51_17]|uniref:Adenylate kinase n=1 Tax=Candidatus Sungbacteria bacterium RIFCSPHIGHO2_02_FULL_51_29 TaxID=1802273 RepID=A0A1G2KSS9_9BACT|nr:MAG: hypothetical protein A3C16_05370 [Candidatus Sungbacteria bacterium RIFCSPHIGHO2_02_FULL_51_29]OHA11945.1 MAG: hypothetical protein A3I44_02540 [Candidatus Sungbacteria bacterium RIFCSPLOWO2_02_FULL_51_17]